jgi:hypothetical protein
MVHRCCATLCCHPAERKLSAALTRHRRLLSRWGRCDRYFPCCLPNLRYAEPAACWHGVGWSCWEARRTSAVCRYAGTCYQCHYGHRHARWCCRGMARSRGAKGGHEGVWNLTSKLRVRQAASAEPSWGSHQNRATHRNWKEGPELSSRWLPLGYRKDPHLALYFRHEDHCHRLRLRRHLSRHLLTGQLDLLHRVRKTSRPFPRQRVIVALTWATP